MKTCLQFGIWFGVLAVWMGGISIPQTAFASAEKVVRVPGMGEVLVGKPIRHKNMTAWLLYKGARPDNEPNYLTLDEAAEKGLVQISEAASEQVQQLSISYKGKLPLFLAAGELVKGGKQDRTLQSSLVVPPKTKLATLPSFCVEASRWAGGKAFRSANNVAANASQQALQFEGQGRVWQSVELYKSKLRSNAARVSGNRPQMSKTSSLNEELEADDVKDLLKSYENAIGNIGANADCPLGIGYAVDGKITAVHVFHSSSLFRKMKEKLVRSAAIDAAVGEIDKTPEKAKIKDLRDFLAQAGDGTKKTMDPGLGNFVTRFVNDKTFTSILTFEGEVVHTQVGRFVTSPAGGQWQRQSIQQEFNPRQQLQQRSINQQDVREQRR